MIILETCIYSRGSTLLFFPQGPNLPGGCENNPKLRNQRHQRQIIPPSKSSCAQAFTMNLQWYEFTISCFSQASLFSVHYSVVVDVNSHMENVLRCPVVRLGSHYDELPCNPARKSKFWTAD